MTSAETVYMILEQDATGVAKNQALDRTTIGDANDPVRTHQLLNRPTDPETAQLLYTASNTPVSWDHTAEEEQTFKLVEHAILPEGSMIEYRIFLNRHDFEMFPLRHVRVPGDESHGIVPEIMGLLPMFEYNIEAHLIVPGRPRQIIAQRVNVIGNPTTRSPNPDPEPAPEPAPNPEPEPGLGGGGNATPPPFLPGFTKRTESPDTNIVYVSHSEGNDANDGSSPEKAVKTLARGVDLMRGGKPDWLLLKAGDVWFKQSLSNLDLSGDSRDKPVVIGSYGGGPRPIIIPPHGEHGLKTVQHKINGMVIQGLHFYAATRDPASNLYQDRPGDVDGINIRIPSGEGRYVEGLVIEDCKITHFDTNIKIVDDWSRKQGEGVPGRIDCKIRRNIVQYSSSNDSHSVGIYLEGTQNSVVEENFIDHNGWAQTDGVEKRNKASHNIYAQWANGPITIRHNYITRGAAHGLQLRAGGNIEHNLFVRNPMAFFTAMSDSKANYNVILESDDMDIDTPSNRRGYGINGWDLKHYEVIGNVIARRVGSLQKPGIDISADRVVIKNNAIYDWQDNRINSSLSYSHSVSAQVSGNLAKEFNNGVEPNYVDPTRGLQTYAGTIGLEPSLEAFLNYLAERPRATWDDNIAPQTVADYVREGFELK